MPAYGKNLSPAEVNALVAFLETLRPRRPGAPRARGEPRSGAAMTQQRRALHG